MYGKFSRCFNLPPNIDESAISAETKNGILKVRIPKTRQTEPKPVQIAVK
jgi:HSP20 family molecular chaperone IbpA